MKFLALVLSFYIFALHSFPCEDSAAVPGMADDTEISTTVDNIIGFQDHHSDLCSPFCQCQCCQMHISYFKGTAYRFTNISISTKVFPYFHGLEKDFNTSLLQPPQI